MRQSQRYKTPRNEPVRTQKIQQPRRRPHQYEMYRIWLSLPAQFIGQTEEHLTKIGVTDTDAIELCKLRTSKQFAEHFKVNKDTLTIWRKELKGDPDVLKAYVADSRILTKNIITALYLNALKYGDVERIKTWMMFVEGWSPRERVMQPAAPFDVVGMIREIERPKSAERLL